ncbi:MAG: hypothetical protein EBR82_60340 [Caulobacteraceae bacterium]|nr:hypothetical protein [Caulobacteraceae bacterium]
MCIRDSHNSLANYYTLNFSLVQHHKYSLTEIENMYPYERDIYVDMLKDYLEKEQERLNNRR